MIDLYDEAYHKKTDLGRKHLLPLNIQLFLKSTVLYGISASVSFNILTRQKIFPEEKDFRFFAVFKPCYCEKDVMRSDTYINQGRK